MKKIYLYPAQLVAVDQPSELSTILGSCVAVALYDRKHGVAGLNHYLLAECPPGETPSPRYASFSIPALIDSMIELGAEKRHLEAKIFGGGNVMSQFSTGYKVGERNIEIAFKMMEEAGIRVGEQNVGGNSGRKISFNTETYEVKHAFMQETEETKYGTTVRARDIKVVIVDDSATVRHLFHKIFAKHGLNVVGAAANPFEAREFIVRRQPDVITLDIEMPQMNGVTFLEKLMKYMPVPTVMVSSLDAKGDAAFRALELGAVEFVHKPSQSDLATLTGFAEMLVEKVKAAATVKVLKKEAHETPPHERPHAARPLRRLALSEIKMLAVGGNTGSQNSLKALLQSLPEDTPPVVVANASIPTFVDAFIQKIAPSCKMRLKIASPGEQLFVGNVYFAPPGHHVAVTKKGLGLTIELTKSAPIGGQLPSANHLLSSVAESAGSGGIGIVLGGFGQDGAEGLLKLRTAGGVTVAQTPESAGFPFVPQASIAMGAVEHVAEVDEIPELVVDYRNRRAA